ncbi:hypothetical protein ACFX11_034320 [Malus domestica]
MNDTSPLVVDVQRTTPTTLTTPFYSLPETYLSPGIENFASPLSQAQREERDDSSIAAHSISGRFPSVSLFKDQGGKFSDGRGACDRREKRFNKPAEKRKKEK